MFHWLHRLFNPHCEHCYEERQCKSCEVLQRELENERREKQQLIKKLLFPENNAAVGTQEDFKPIMRTAVPWGARRQQYEVADRAEAERIKVAKLKEMEELRDKNIAALESALEIKEN